MLDRLELLIGKENINILKNSSILVLGLGGVGGFVVESLVRSGIGTITIVDCDRIDITNINRQIIATNDSIDKLKTEEFKKRILSINSQININCINEFINEKNMDLLFENKIDYLIDACDFIPTKKLIISKCIKENINFITCTGTGNRMDPTKLRITDIRKTSYDPVAKILRKYVTDENIKEKVMCLNSTEIPIRKGKIIGSNSFVPSSAGLIISSFVIKELINFK